MPIYEYEPLTDGCALCGGRFEELRDLHDAELEQCSTCDAPCRRVVSGFSAHTSARAAGGLLSKANIERNGFVRYEKSREGTWDKTAGDDRAPGQLKRGEK